MARTEDVEAELLNGRMLVHHCRASSTPPLPCQQNSIGVLWTAALELVTFSSLARAHSTLQGSPPLTLPPLQHHFPGALPVLAFSLAAPFLRHIPTMATLRFTLLVATLLGLALLASPRDAVANPPRAAAVYTQCIAHYRFCASYRQRCSECTVSCLEAKEMGPLSALASIALNACKRLKSQMRARGR